jgi:hypothetical protein
MQKTKTVMTGQFEGSREQFRSIPLNKKNSASFIRKIFKKARNKYRTLIYKEK